MGSTCCSLCCCSFCCCCCCSLCCCCCCCCCCCSLPLLAAAARCPLLLLSLLLVPAAPEMLKIHWFENGNDPRSLPQGIAKEAWQRRSLENPRAKRRRARSHKRRLARKSWKSSIHWTAPKLHQKTNNNAKAKPAQISPEVPSNRAFGPPKIKPFFLVALVPAKNAKM